MVMIPSLSAAQVGMSATSLTGFDFKLTATHPNNASAGLPRAGAAAMMSYGCDDVYNGLVNLGSRTYGR